MVTRRTGLTVETSKNLVIDSGEVRINYVDGASPGTLLGATREGSTFTLTQEIKQIAVDGAKGPVKGLRRITSVQAQITANLIEWSTDAIKYAMPGSTSEDFPSVDPTHDEITRALNIQAGLDCHTRDDYISSVAIIGQVGCSDEPIVIIINNAIADGSPEFSLVDNEESTLSLQFTAHFTPDALDTEPWIIRYPQIAVES